MSTPRIAELPSDVNALRCLVLEMQRKLNERDALIAFLEEWKRLHQSRRFGATSEQIPGEQPALFNEAEATLDAAVVAGESTGELDDAADTTRIPAHTRAKPGRCPPGSSASRCCALREIRV